MEAKELGQFIAKLRKEQQMTQAELAERLHVTDKAVSRWERGLGFPDINTLEPLAASLGVSLAELMRCAKKSEGNQNANDEDAGILESIALANVQRKKLVKTTILGVFGCMTGLCIALYAVYLFINRSWSVVLGGNDGATAVFVASKMSGLFPILMMVVGIAILFVGVFMLHSSK